MVDDEAAPIVQRIFDLYLAGWCRKAIAEQLTWSELEAYVDQLGDIGLALGRAEAEGRRQLYESLRLSLIYHHGEQIVDVEIDPLADRVEKYRVRGAMRALPTRLKLSA